MRVRDAEDLEVPSVIEREVERWQRRYEREARGAPYGLGSASADRERRMRQQDPNYSRSDRVNFNRYQSLWEFLAALRVVGVEVDEDTRIGVFLQAGKDPFLFVDVGSQNGVGIRWIGAFLGAGLRIELGPFRQLLSVSYYALTQLDGDWEIFGTGGVLPFLGIYSGWAVSAQSEVRLMELLGGTLGGIFRLQYEDFPGTYQHVFGWGGLRFNF